MAATEILRARVEKAFADKVARWAKAHDVDISEAVRLGLKLMIEREEREREVEARIRRSLAILDESERLGLFDPPKDDSWKAGGFR